MEDAGSCNRRQAIYLGYKKGKMCNLCLLPGVPQVHSRSIIDSTTYGFSTMALVYFYTEYLTWHTTVIRLQKAHTIIQFLNASERGHWDSVMCRERL